MCDVAPLGRVDQPTFQVFPAHGEHSFITVTSSLAWAVPLHMTNLVTPEALAPKSTTVLPWSVPLTIISSTAFELTSVPIGLERLLHRRVLLLQTLMLL